MDDVWYVIKLLKEEVEEHNATSERKFEIHEAIKSHLPFFACTNNFINKEYQRDIQRYTYCKKMKVPPYEGSYGEQPFRWVNRAFAIKTAIAKKEKREIENGKNKS